MNRQFHEAADLFPLLQGAAFEELVADIRKNGLLEPILLDGEGRILDGRNRYRACLAAGVEPQFEEWKGKGSLAELALSLNLKRRHLGESQRALVAARLAKMMEAEANKRRGRRPELVANVRPIPRRRSSDEAAAMVNVSGRLVTYAIKVLRDGCDELVAAVESGQLPVSTAARLAALPKAEQTQAAAGGPAGLLRKARELRARESKTSAASESWPFGVLQEVEPSALTAPHNAAMVFLWVPTSGLPAALEALRARGFRREPPEMR